MTKITMDGKYTTRDGREVRVLCVDAPGDQPVVASIKLGFGWFVASYNADGTYNYGGSAQSEKDLIPAKTKCEGWVNVYRIHRITIRYDTKEEAENHSSDLTLDTVHIEW